MSRNQYVDYYEVTGYLPRIERNKAVCWHGAVLYLGGNPCYQGASKYLNAEETREYMSKRFGYPVNSLGKSNFDGLVNADTVSEQVKALTITKTGRMIYDEGTPIGKIPAGIQNLVKVNSDGIRENTLRTKETVVKSVDVDQDKPGIVGNISQRLAAMGLVAVLALGFIGYLLFRNVK